MDIEGEEGIEVSISTEPGLGTVYSVNIPIRRVKVCVAMNLACIWSLWVSALV